MSDDYLWDKQGEPDQEVAELERVLGTLKHRPEAEADEQEADEPEADKQEADEPEADESEAEKAGPKKAAAEETPEKDRRAGERKAGDAKPERGHPFAAAATLIVLAAAVLLLLKLGRRVTSYTGAPEGPSLPVLRLEGQPRVGAEPVTDKAALLTGMLLDTDDHSSARIDLAGMGEVVLERASRVRLVETSDKTQHLVLLRGSLRAKVTAPPRVFVVDTPYATATDLGCAYRLEVAPNGRTFLTVESGEVLLESGKTSAWVPAKAECEVHPNAGIGTPRFGDAPPALREALDHYDFEDKDHEALVAVLAAARVRDTLSLWSLVQRTDGDDRAAVIARVRELVPAQGWTADDALAGDPKAVEAMKRELAPHW